MTPFTKSLESGPLMTKKQLVILSPAEQTLAALPVGGGRTTGPSSPWRAFELQALGNLQQRINEVTLVSFTRLEARQLLTSIERIEEIDLGPDLAFDSLREKLRIAIQRMSN